MDKNRWQTISTFDLVQSSYKWIPAILLRWNHSTTMQTWIVSRLWFCRRPWRLTINSITIWFTNLSCLKLWKFLVNLQDCVWENHCRLIMKTTLQEKETIHWITAIWFTKLFLCVKSWGFPQRRTRNGKNWRKFRRGTWRKSKVRKRWSMKQGRRALQFILHH